MSHHVTDGNPTHHVSECAATIGLAALEAPMRIRDADAGWFHMCGKDTDHKDVHECGECGVWWL